MVRSLGVMNISGLVGMMMMMMMMMIVSDYDSFYFILSGSVSPRVEVNGGPGNLGKN